MKRIPLIVVPLALMFVVAAVWMSPASGTKAPTPSVDVSGVVPVDLSAKPVPRDVEDSGCFFDCGVEAIEPGSGGKCWVMFTVFHSDCTQGCCDHCPPSQVVFCYRYQGAPAWCYDSAYKGTYAYSESAGCYGYYYLSAWMQLDDHTTWQFYFQCASGCYCAGSTYVDCS